MKTLIIGCGNMGKTYARSFLLSRFIRPSDMYLLNRSEIDLKQFPGLPASNFNTKPGEYIANADIIIIAVKPQDFEQLASSMRNYTKEDQLVLSVMAGIKIQNLAD